jgi:predicted ATPase
MINSFEITNFRCFQYLPPVSLKRFNVLVGDSGTGKTSLIEALFLCAGSSPEIYLRLRTWRGFGPALSLAGTKESFESIFRDLFNDFHQELGAKISCPDTSGGVRNVEIKYEQKKEYDLPLEGIGQNAFLIDPIVFEWDVAGKIYRSSLEIKEGKLTISGTAPVSPLVMLSPAIKEPSTQNANSFSALSKKFRAALITDAVSKLFPEVKEITVEIVAGEPVLHVNSGLAERLPIADVSGGIAKFISIALAILTNPSGTVLVDEFESGFYYQKLPEIWRSLVELARLKGVDCQLIVTTHSYEFLTAVSKSLDDKEIASETLLLRLEKSEDGKHTVDRVKARQFHSAIESGLEVR